MLELYFKFKNKNGYSFTEKEALDFESLVLDKLAQNKKWLESSSLIIPETSNTGLINLAKKSGKSIVTLNKASKAEIIKELDKQSMMKSEREKLYSSISQMDIVKIAAIAGNQRKRFIACLFTPLQEDVENALFFDDSIFSGYTFLAAQYQLKKSYSSVILFDKNL